LPGLNAAQSNYIYQIAQNEVDHVRFLRSAPGTSAVPRPDIGVGFQAVPIEPAGTTNGVAAIVDAQTGSPNYSETYSRTTTEVLKIVTCITGAPASGAKYTGLFFPSGLNGVFS
jgi:hypothetical protein